MPTQISQDYMDFLACVKETKNDRILV